MVLRFSGSLVQSCQDLKSALENKDEDEARRHAHSIAGAAGNLSADTLRRHAKTLELAIKFGQGSYQKMLDDLEHEVARVTAGIQQLTEMVGGAAEPKSSRGTQSQSPEELRRLLTVFEELIQALDEGDLEAIGQVAATLKDLQMPDSFNAEFERLTELVDGFDYAEAIELARSLQSRIER